MRLQLPAKYRPLFTPSRYKAMWGGRGAARSHSCASALVVKGTLRPERWLCCREIQKAIRDSSKRLLDDKIRLHGLSDFYESTDTEIRGENGTLFLFAGLRTNADSIKSMEGLTGAWIEEARSVSQTSLDILTPTVRADDSEIWATWNPRFPTDPIDKFFRGKDCPPDTIKIEATYQDNPWFPEVLRRDMEWDRARDPDKYAHIWLGDYQKNSEARVFKNFRVERLQVPKGCRPYYGGDWGFSVDPSVLVRCYIWDRTLYIEAEVYQIGVETDYLPAFFAGSDRRTPPRWPNPDGRYWGIPGATDWPITVDSARPETISYMNKRGFKLQPAKKGAGSVEEGIEFLQSYDIVINPDCTHVVDEFSLFSFKVDKLTQEVLPVLEDKDNHTIDSVRYAVEGVRRGTYNLAQLVRG